MIPLRLTVNNFMCYRDNVPPLDLEGIHVACLCGENGHGKTALLDAITWALWGQSRARTQEELIHQGRRDMAVDLEFMARDQRYRVSRKYSRSGRSKQGATLLELQVVSDNGHRPITGNTVRETEARIREIIHMDYDTFVNTAFLLQGQADMFTRSSPSMRKERLAEVLDLSYYQRLEERAKQRSRELQDKAKSGESAIAMRQQELARKPEYEEKLASINADLARIEPEVVARRQETGVLRESVDSLRARRHELDTLNSRLAASRDEIADLKRQMENHQSRIGNYEAALQRESEIREQHARLEETRAELERLDKASFEATRLDQERAKLNEAVAVQRERLTGQVAQLRSRITEDLEPTTKRLPKIEEGLREAAREQAELDEMERELRQRRDEAQEISVRVRSLEETNANLLNGMEETRQKFDMLDLTEAQCPLCKQPLGPEGKEHLRREYESQGTDAKRRYQEHTAEKERLKQSHEELETQSSRQEGEINRRRQQLQTSTATQERDLAEARKAQDELKPAIQELERLRTQLDAGEFALEERRTLAELDAGLSSLGYDDENHRRAQEQVKALDPFADLHRRLLEAMEALPAERKALESARQMLDRRRQEIERDEGRLNELERELKTLPSLEAELVEAQSAFQTLEEQKQGALVQQGVLTEQLDGLTKVEAQSRELEQELKNVLDEKSVCDELTVAFGKNGIQALIIETAIPQLQEDANELLGRLTESRMSLKLQLQEGRKERRMGLPSEELEIKIADEIGTRSYETFSGGEAFRINFALRIALSKLLARRSGAPLPILFIDEGFGTQDSAGQERLKEAIQSIHSDFQKIIVITHVEQIKDAFPTRIEVTKTGSGSTFVVV